MDEIIRQFSAFEPNAAHYSDVDQKILILLKKKILTDIKEHQDKLNSQTVFKRLYHHTDGQRIIITQLAYEKAENAFFKEILFIDQPLRLFEITPIQNNSQSNVIFNIIAIIHVDTLKVFKKRIADAYGYPFIDLEGVNNLSSLEFKTQQDLEIALNKNFHEISRLTGEKGYWTLPQQLQEQLGQWFSCTPITEDKAQVAKSFFAKYPQFLKKFIELKIKEFSQYLFSSTDFNQPESEIYLSLLIQNTQCVTIIEARILFQDELAVSVVDFSETEQEKLLDCIVSSSWLINNSNKTILRFADQSLETSLEIKYFCSAIQYGIISDKISRKSRSSNLNFWEDLAINWKLKAASDFSQLNNFKRQLDESDKVDPTIVLEKNVSDIARETDGIEQTQYVEQVLKNQRRGYGTLLYLPTGFGKTFIMLMAIAQHYRDSDIKKPYLVIAPKSVAEVWRDNIELLNQRAEQSGQYLFGVSCKINEGNDNLKEIIESSTQINDAHIFISTTDSLSTYVKKNCLNLTKESLANISDEELTLLHELAIIGMKLEKYNQDKDIIKSKKNQNIEHPLELRNKKGMLFYLLGNERFWQDSFNRIRKFPYQSIQNFLSDDMRNIDFYFPRARNSKKIQLSELQKNKIRFIESENNKISSDSGIRVYLQEYGISAENNDISEKLFDYIGLYLFFLSDNGPDKLQLLVEKLNKLKTFQDERIGKLIKLRQFFSGVILDESESQFTTYNVNKSLINDLIFDMAAACQNRAQPGSKQNPLLIAASATPWRNHLSEFILHMKFLLPKLMGQYQQVIRNFMNSWDQLENLLQSEDFFRDGEIKSAELDKKLQPVSTFQEWVQYLFQKIVCYEKPDKSVTNTCQEIILPVKCHNKFDMNNKGTLETIRHFYSHYLDVNDKNTNDKEPNSNILSEISNLMGNPNNQEKKFAFYVELQQDAENLGQFIYNLFPDNKNRVTGFYYAKNFEEDMHALNLANGRKYQTRGMNLNAFNSEFNFDDYFQYVTWNYNTDAQELLKDKKLRKLRSLVNDLQIICKNKPTEMVTTSLRDKLDINSNTATMFYQFFYAIIQLQQGSHEIILMDLKQRLLRLWLIVAGSAQNTTEDNLIKFLEDFDATFVGKTEKKYEPHQIIIYTLLSYLFLMTNTNVIIFGQAASSGIRIDADYLFMLSGAWTEGLLNQVRGRVGRIKSKTSNSTRKCTVYMPLTDTLFELFILKYYVLKFLYNEFLTSKESYPTTELCSVLFLTGELERIYKEAYAGKAELAFHSARNHTLISELGMSEAAYIHLSPFDKAVNIIKILTDPRIHIRWQQVVEKLSEKYGQIGVKIADNVNVRERTPSAAIEAQPIPDNNLTIKLSPSIANSITRKNDNTTNKSPPKIISNIDKLLSDAEQELLKKFIDDNQDRDIIILSLPTRGNAPDLTQEEFSQYLRQSIEETNICFIVLFGINQVQDTGSPEKYLSRPIEDSSKNTNWYSDDDINKLLRTVLDKNKDTYFLDAMLGTDRFAENTLSDQLMQYLKQRQQGLHTEPKIIVPINLNNSHWVLVYLTFSNNTQQLDQIFYIDPTGQSVPKVMETNFKSIFPKIVVNSSKVPLQEDGFNCGPWVIAAAKYLVKQNKINDISTIMRHLQGIDIYSRRKEYNLLLSPSSESNPQIFQTSQNTEATISDHLFFKSITFQWCSKDKIKNSIPPLGQMRNFCLSKAQEMYQTCVKNQPEQKIFFMSMDGDTALTDKSLLYVFNKVLSQKYSVATAGYDMCNSADDFTKLISRISINIYAEMYWPEHRYFGYLAEPCILLSSDLTTLLFQQSLDYQQFSQNYDAPFGFWDCEGRQIIRFLKKLIGQEQYAIYGPSQESKDRPILLNVSHKFKVAAPEFPLNIPLTRAQLIIVIKKMCGQSQNCIDPFFMGSNIAVALSCRPPTIRKFARYFYLRSFLELLNLGPFRASGLLVMMYRKTKGIINQINTGDLSDYAINIDPNRVLTFINVFFIQGLENIIKTGKSESHPPQEKIHDIKGMLLLWALTAAHQLLRNFGSNYQEEMKDGKYCIDMALPSDYPERSEELNQEDSGDEISSDDEFNLSSQELIEPIDDVIPPKQIAESLLNTSSNNSAILETCLNEIKEYFKKTYTGRELLPEQDLLNCSIIEIILRKPAADVLIIKTNEIIDFEQHEYTEFIKQQARDLDKSKPFIIALIIPNTISGFEISIGNYWVADWRKQLRKIVFQKAGDFKENISSIPLFAASSPIVSNPFSIFPTPPAATTTVITSAIAKNDDVGAPQPSAQKKAKTSEDAVIDLTGESQLKDSTSNLSSEASIKIGSSSKKQKKIPSYLSAPVTSLFH